jgi:hypothetical protein
MPTGSLRTLVLLGLVVLGALIILCPQLPGVCAALRTTGDRKTSPDFELTDASDAKIRLADYQGRVVLSLQTAKLSSIVTTCSTFANLEGMRLCVEPGTERRM